MSEFEKLFVLYQKWVTHKLPLSKFAIDNYLGISKNCLAYFDNFGISGLKDIDQEIFEGFLYATNGKRFTASYITLRKAALNQFFSWAYENGYCHQNPLSIIKINAINTKRPGLSATENNKRIVYLTEAEQASLVTASANSDFVGIRNKCVLILALASALFIEEIIGLNVDNLNLEQGFIEITGDERRQRRAVLDLTICKKAVQAWLRMRQRQLKNCNKEMSLLFFTQEFKPLTRRVLHLIISEQMINARINKERLGAETLRQTAICNLFKKGYTLEEVQNFTGVKTLSRLEEYRKTLISE